MFRRANLAVLDKPQSSLWCLLLLALNLDHVHYVGFPKSILVSFDIFTSNDFTSCEGVEDVERVTRATTTPFRTATNRVDCFRRSALLVGHQFCGSRRWRGVAEFSAVCCRQDVPALGGTRRRRRRRRRRHRCSSPASNHLISVVKLSSLSFITRNICELSPLKCPTLYRFLSDGGLSLLTSSLHHFVLLT